MIEILLTNFVFLWTVIDPIGTVPVFMAVTKSSDTATKRKIARKAVLISAGIFLFFILLGQGILEGMSIPLSAFQIAGGIVLFIFALTMIIGESKPQEEIHQITHNKRDESSSAVFPLAMPSIASPGSLMAIVLLTDNHRFQLIDQLITSTVLIVVLFIQWLLLLGSEKIHKLIGIEGASIISRIMGLILASVAVNSVLMGIKDFFGIA